MDFACVLFPMLNGNFSEFTSHHAFFFLTFQPQQVVQKKPAQVRKADLKSLDYLKLNTPSVFSLVSFTVKSEGKCINNMKQRIAAGFLGRTTRAIHAVALGKERKQQ